MLKILFDKDSVTFLMGLPVNTYCGKSIYLSDIYFFSSNITDINGNFLRYKTVNPEKKLLFLIIIKGRKKINKFLNYFEL